MNLTIRVCSGIVCLLAIFLPSASASAQYRPLPQTNPVVWSDPYHVEFGVMLLSPPLDATVTSSNFGITGTPIAMDADLGMSSKALFEVRLTLRPSRRQKLRVSYLPQTFTNEYAPKEDLIFNGIRFSAGRSVTSTYKWTGWRFSYEYDFLSGDRGFAGLVLEAKYTDANLELKNSTDDEFIRARAPLPALGLIGRYCFMPNLCMTGELSGFGIPDSASKKYYARYVDLDLYGTFYVVANAGVVAGFRSIDAEFRVKNDAVKTSTRSPYIGGVVRF